MVYFDKKTLKLLKYIYKHPKVSHDKLKSKFKDTINWKLEDSLADFVNDTYVTVIDKDGEPHYYFDLPYDDNLNFRYFTDSKGQEFVDSRIYNFWKWTIPIFISVLSLIISVATLLFSQFGNDVIKVLLLDK